MSKLPIITAKKFEKVLLNLGFKKIRQKGSHVFYRHPDGRYTTVPHHQGEDIGMSLTREILKEISLSPEEFKEQLKKV